MEEKKRRGGKSQKRGGRKTGSQPQEGFTSLLSAVSKHLPCLFTRKMGFVYEKREQGDRKCHKKTKNTGFWREQPEDRGHHEKCDSTAFYVQIDAKPTRNLSKGSEEARKGKEKK